MRRAYILAAGALGMVLPTSCSSEVNGTPKPSDVVVHEVVNKMGRVTLAVRADKIPNISSGDKGYDKVKKIQTQDTIYPNGKDDDNLPVLTKTSPLRLRTQVTLGGGDSPRLSNDEACDDIKVGEDITSIGAVSLGNNGQSFMVWVEQDFLRICFPQNHEPDTIILEPNTPAQ